MIISFTGAQSTGKTTLLESLKLDDRFRKFNFVNEVTRLVKKKYNLSINEKGDDKTQLAILNQHLENNLLYSKTNVIMDRCILDGLVYTTWLYTKKKVSEQVLEYAEFLTDTLIDDVDIIFYTEPDIPLVDDGVRSVDTKFRNEIVHIFDEAIHHFDIKVIRLSGSVEDRKKIVYNTFDNYGK